MGVHSVNMDSPVQAASTDVKRSGGTSEKPCHGCLVSKSQLGDGDFDVVRHRRTPDQIEHGLRLLAEEPNLAKRGALSTKIGVVFTDSDNPFRKHLHLNLVRQVATDVFHQDSLVSIDVS